MLKKIAEDVLNTYMGKSPNEVRVTNRLGMWLFIFLSIGIAIGTLISIIF